MSACKTKSDSSALQVSQRDSEDGDSYLQEILEMAPVTLKSNWKVKIHWTVEKWRLFPIWFIYMLSANQNIEHVVGLRC